MGGPSPLGSVIHLAARYKLRQQRGAVEAALHCRLAGGRVVPAGQRFRLEPGMVPCPGYSALARAGCSGPLAGDGAGRG